ncbi:MAG: Spy/CpxP family protein refolding chaperone [Gallionellaceae bacterium]
METKTAKLIYLIPTLVLGGILMAALHTVAIASPVEHDWHMGTGSEQKSELIKMRLQRMEDRLEIKASQQTAWEEYANAVAALAEHPVKKPEGKEDAATLSHYSADRVAEFAKKLSRVADATDKLQSVLNEDQRKVLDKIVQNRIHEWKHDGQHCDHKHEKDGHGGMDRKMHHDDGHDADMTDQK